MTGLEPDGETPDAEKARMYRFREERASSPERKALLRVLFYAPYEKAMKMAENSGGSGLSAVLMAAALIVLVIAFLIYGNVFGTSSKVNDMKPASPPTPTPANPSSPAPATPQPPKPGTPSSPPPVTPPKPVVPQQ